MSIYYTDGSCNGNGQEKNTGGFGIVITDDAGNIVNAYSKRCENTTNNREEIKAILVVMLLYGKPQSDWDQPPIVYSDSNYCVQTFNEWMFNWARNNWLKSDKKPPENLDLIKTYYDYYMQGYRIDLRKIKGHAGNKWNELADQLATGKISPEDVYKVYG